MNDGFTFPIRWRFTIGRAPCDARGSVASTHICGSIEKSASDQVISNEIGFVLPKMVEAYSQL
jgi:hypothetical protein